MTSRSKRPSPTTYILRLGVLLGLAGLNPLAPALADEIVADPQVITQCLCMQKAAETSKKDLDAATASWQQATQRAASLRQQVNQQRPNVNVNDPAAVEAFTKLVHDADTAEIDLNNVSVPAYNAAVTSYGQAAAAENNACAGRQFDVAAMRQVRINLNTGLAVCPKP